MRGVIQRVKSASVTVDNALISQIGRGVMVLVGLTEGDSTKEAEQLCKKVLNTRLWPGDDGRPWVKNVIDIGGEVLLVSQFTLYASLKSMQYLEFVIRKHSSSFHMFEFDFVHRTPTGFPSCNGSAACCRGVFRIRSNGSRSVSV
jgi:D-tyrosyl-tRNA(Tyr) deacylase